MKDVKLAADVGRTIREYRKAAGLSQRDLSGAAGLTQPQMCNIENGKSSPSLTTLAALAKSLGTTPGDIVNCRAPSKKAASGGEGAPDYKPMAMERLVSKIAADSAAAEPESAPVETIARAVCLLGGKLLVCRGKGAEYCYLPGGHIEPGETGRAALAREIREETGLDAKIGEFLGAVENSFEQNGAPHSEINLVYSATLPEGAEVRSAEDWIEFEWVPMDALAAAGLLPEAFRSLSAGTRFFSC